MHLDRRLRTAGRPPPVDVPEAPGRTVDPHELDAAVRTSTATKPAAAPTPGRWVVLEALPDLDDELLTAAAPHVHEPPRDVRAEG